MLIACRDAAFAYEGATVIQGLTFEVRPGDYICVAGENGSGKSTLLKGLLGLLPVQRGEIVRDTSLEPGDIGYLPQYKGAQKDFPAGVYEVVISGRQARRRILPFYAQADKQAAEENLNRLGIAGLRNRCYRELSVGQQQRVLLARAFCAARKLLLLDEPAAGLDPLAAGELYRVIEAVNRINRLAVIMVSHDVQTAVTYANRILHLRGEQLFWGSPAEYAESPPGKRFLGTP